MKRAGEGEDGCEEKRERDNVLNTGGSYCALTWTSHRGSQTCPGVAHFVFGWEPITASAWTLARWNQTERKPSPVTRINKFRHSLDRRCDTFTVEGLTSCGNGARHKEGRQRQEGRCRGRSGEGVRSERKRADPATVVLGAPSFLPSQCPLLHTYKESRACTTTTTLLAAMDDSLALCNYCTHT